MGKKIKFPVQWNQSQVCSSSGLGDSATFVRGVMTIWGKTYVLVSSELFWKKIDIQKNFKGPYRQENEISSAMGPIPSL